MSLFDSLKAWFQSVINPKWTQNDRCHNCDRLLLVTEMDGRCPWCGHDPAGKRAV